MAFYRFLEEFQRRLAITALGDIGLQYFALVIYGPPQIVGFAVNFDENLVQMPLPM